MRHVRSWALLLLASSSSLVARPARAMEPRVAECLASSEKAESLRRDGRYREARRAFASCGADSCPAVVRRDCIASLTEVDRLEPTLVFAARDEHGNDVADVAVSIDGELVAEKLDGKPVGVDAGQHVVTFVASPRYRDERVTVVARTGEKNRIVSVQLTPQQSAPAPAPTKTKRPDAEPPRSEPLPVLPLVLAGAGVVALGAFAYLGLSAKSDLNALESSPCAATKTCSESDVDSVRTRFTFADVSLGVGAVAIGAAAWLFFTRDRAPTTAARPLDVRATSHGVTVQLERSF